MRLGKVTFYNYYIVDLDNEDQVEDAKIMLCEDIYNGVKYDELGGYIDIVEDASLSEADIHPVLRYVNEDD